MQNQLLEVSSRIGKDNLFNKDKIWQISHQNSPNQKIIQKIIQLDRGGSAILLKSDYNKPIRFLYLCLLMSKKNSFNVSALLAKMTQICSKTDQIIFLGINSQTKNTFMNNPHIIYRNLIELHKRMQLNKFSQTFILQLILQNRKIDELLILVIRAIAHEYSIMNSLDCQETLTLGQVELLLNKFFVDKGAITNQRNKYVIFWGFDDHQIKNLKAKQIIFQTQSQNYQQILDPYPLKNQNFIMVEKIFSILDEQLN